MYWVYSMFCCSGPTMVKRSAVELFQICGFKADMHKPDLLRGLLLRIHLDELPVVHLEEHFCGDSILGEGEGLLKPELLIEVARASEIRDANGNVRDPGEGRGRRYLRLYQHSRQK
jgi:hypothetical protein